MTKKQKKNKKRDYAVLMDNCMTTMFFIVLGITIISLVYLIGKEGITHNTIVIIIGWIILYISLWVFIHKDPKK